MEIYTIGHSNLVFEEFTELIPANGIEIMVDVMYRFRTFATSRPVAFLKLVW